MVSNLRFRPSGVRVPCHWLTAMSLRTADRSLVPRHCVQFHKHVTDHVCYSVQTLQTLTGFSCCSVGPQGLGSTHHTWVDLSGFLQCCNLSFSSFLMLSFPSFMSLDTCLFHLLRLPSSTSKVLGAWFCVM